MKKFMLAVALLACGQMMAMSDWDREMLNAQLENGLRDGISYSAGEYAHNRSTTNGDTNYTEQAKWTRAYTAYALESIKKGASWGQFLKNTVESTTLHNAIEPYYIKRASELEEKIANDMRDIRSAISEGTIAFVVKKDDSQENDSQEDDTQKDDFQRS